MKLKTYILLASLALAFVSPVIAQTAIDTPESLGWSRAVPAITHAFGTEMYLVVEWDSPAPNLQITSAAGVARMATLPGANRVWRRLDADMMAVIRRAASPTAQPPAEPKPDPKAALLLAQINDLLAAYFAEAK